MTLQDVKDKLIQEYDEVTLLEFLQVDATLLVDRFSDIIERDFEKFETLVAEPDDEDYIEDDVFEND